jgi:tetratricopeptide (TPR) repeat protein
LPALGAGAALGAGGAALANRLGDRGSASLPGLGDRGPGASQLPADSIGDRRDALNERLGGDREQARGDRQQTRDDRQQTREQTRGDRQETRGDRQEGRQETRGDRQETRGDRQETRGDRQETRGDRQETRGDRQEGRQETRGDRQENRQQGREDRRQSWEDRRNDWQDHRDDIRQDWQDYRDTAREDWQGWFDDHYGGLYGGWYGGYASGYWDQWDSLWDEYPVAAAAGLTWWGANSLGYLFGYSDYYNPYYAEGMPAYYTEPVVTTVPIEVTQQTTTTVAAPPPSVSSEGVTKFDQARASFLEGKYEEALRLTDAAVAQMPHDAVLHEFRSLVLFALRRYAESAAAIHPVLDVGPGWDWKTLSGLYPSTDEYTHQLRNLESARDKNPKAAELRFLLGYHYLSCGFPDKALDQFSQALELRPNDSVTTSLVATLSPRSAEPAQAPTGATPKAVPGESVVGTWKAKGKGTGDFSMSLAKDGSFTWGFGRGKRKEEVKGVHTVEGNVLAMEPDSGGVLLAELTLKDPDTLHFKMIGGAKDDPGLEFKREAAKKVGKHSVLPREEGF